MPHALLLYYLEADGVEIEAEAEVEAEVEAEAY
jgi:hypothetical protein